MTWTFSSAALPNEPLPWTLSNYGIFHDEVLYAVVDIKDFKPGGVWAPWQQAYLFCRDLVRKLNNLEPLPPMLDRSQIKVYEA